MTHISFDRTSLYVLLFICLQLVNILFLSSQFLFVFSIVEMFVVFSFLLKHKIEMAVLLHVVFSVVTCDQNTLDEETEMLAYSSIKLVGPLTMSYIILGLIWLSVYKRPIKIPDYSLFVKLRSLFLYLLFCGCLLGGLGLFLFGYSFRDFITPLRYMLVAVLFSDVLCRLYSEEFLKKIYIISICLVISVPISGALGYFVFGASYGYSIFESFIASPIITMAPMLLLIYIKKLSNVLNIWILLSLFCFLLLTVSSGRGSQFVTLFLSIVILIYQVYFTNIYRNSSKARILRFLLPFIILGGTSYILIMLDNVGQSLASNKLQQFISLFSIFGNNSGAMFDEVGFSPYVRVAEVLNVIDNGIHNPFCLFFGKGYGGYYTDSLGLFNGLDLSNGAFGDEAIKLGRFGTAHSMYPNTLLFHGVLGFYFVVKLGIKYLRNINQSFLVFSAFVLLLYSLYFNVTLLTASIFFLFAAETSIIYKESK